MDSIELISDSDQQYLEIVETQSFDPVGWLYQTIFDDLLERGFVVELQWGHFLINEAGKEALARKRASK
jgi:hypothetical protein